MTKMIPETEFSIIEIRLPESHFMVVADTNKGHFEYAQKFRTRTDALSLIRFLENNTSKVLAKIELNPMWDPLYQDELEINDSYGEVTCYGAFDENPFF